jgi:hypothetical protein
MSALLAVLENPPRVVVWPQKYPKGTRPADEKVIVIPYVAAGCCECPAPRVEPSSEALPDTNMKTSSMEGVVGLVQLPLGKESLWRNLAGLSLSVR